MMEKSDIPPHEQITTGDAAVDGLLAGIAAGLVKAAYLLLAGLIGGIGLPETLLRLDAQLTSGLRGLLAHLAVAAIYGAIFGLLNVRIPLGFRGWRAGLAYSLILVTFSWFILLPVAAPALRTLGPLHWTAGHLLFGVLLGVLVARSPSGARS
jgi:hypothetical protein